MTEVQTLQVQLVAVLALSDEVDRASDVFERKQALDRLHAAIQEARPLITVYAAELMVS